MMSTATAMKMSLRLHVRYSDQQLCLQAADNMRPTCGAGVVAWSLQELSTSFCHQIKDAKVPDC